METFKPAPSSNYETEDSRQVRLTKLAIQTFPELQPDEDIQLASAVLREREGFQRLALGDPSFLLTGEAIDPDVKAAVHARLASHEVRGELAELRGALHQQQQVEVLNATAAVGLERREETLEKRVHELDGRLGVELDQEQFLRGDLNTIESVQQHFDELKAKHGTIGALRTLLEPGRLKSEAMRDHVRRALDTANAVKVAVPGKSAIVETLLNAAPLNLAAPSPTVMFAGFLGSVESSSDLTDSDKREIRAVFIKEQSIQTGRDVRAVASQTVIDPDTGETEPAYAEGHPKQVRDGVEAFTRDGEDLMLRFKRKDAVPFDYDVSNWPDSSIGLVTEALSFAVGLEEVGLGIFADPILDQTALGLEAPLDTDDLHQLRAVLSALIGGFEAYDGDIFEVSTRQGLLTYQADLLGLTKLKPEQQTQRMLELGLQNPGGQLDLDAVGWFGRFSRSTFGLSRPTDEQLKNYVVS